MLRTRIVERNGQQIKVLENYQAKPCLLCQGSGAVGDQLCPQCEGQREVWVSDCAAMSHDELKHQQQELARGLARQASEAGAHGLPIIEV